MLNTMPVTRMQGASLTERTCSFRVWAPNAKQVALRLVGQRDLPMHPEPDGNFLITADAAAGGRYFYLVDGQPPVPDPVSRLLPEGVHGPTEIVDPASFEWIDDDWRGVELRDAIIYELHVGTFTAQGTFDGAIERLEYLRRLGVTMVELMPVAAFPGTRNWGYDGVSPYAVQASYGGPNGLKRLVNAAHMAGLGVILDVVYNHLGHEGNYLRWFGPYFTHRHQTPWGDAINYDGEGCEGVRRYFMENALYWVREYHLDGLRLDAVQTIHDDSPRHILAEIQDEVQTLAREGGRRVLVIAESDENDAKLVRPQTANGLGLDAQWSDDFHHSVHAFLTGERHRYYQDFGRPEQIVRALEQGFVFQGEPFKFWGKPRGSPAAEVPLAQHIICLQNHDQVGNRAQGERLASLLSPGALKAAAALLLLAPETPLLFMGEEYGEVRPFQYFTSYSDPQLAQAVRQGRKNEFKDFTGVDVPDPQDPKTFERSKLDWGSANGQNAMLRWYQQLMDLRKTYVSRSLRTCKAELLEGGVIKMHLPAEEPEICVLASLTRDTLLPGLESSWSLRLKSAEDGFEVCVYLRSK